MFFDTTSGAVLKKAQRLVCQHCGSAAGSEQLRRPGRRGGVSRCRTGHYLVRCLYRRQWRKRKWNKLRGRRRFSSGSPLGNGYAGTTGTVPVAVVAAAGDRAAASTAAAELVVFRSDGVFTGAPAVDARSAGIARSNAFADPLLRLCNGTTPVLKRYHSAAKYAQQSWRRWVRRQLSASVGAMPAATAELGGGGGVRAKGNTHQQQRIRWRRGCCDQTGAAMRTPATAAIGGSGAGDRRRINKAQADRLA